jgi:hypothetical protein
MQSITLRDYQALGVRHALQWAEKAASNDRILYAAPTGSGKSITILVLQSKLGAGWWVITPKLEIIVGMLEKCGIACEHWSEARIIDTAWALCITTPVRLKNRLLSGDGPDICGLILDEGHHDLAQTWQDISLLCGTPPAIGFTATPFRGTPKGTAEFRKLWGEPVWLVTYPGAIKRKVIKMPRCIMLPLVDDDLIEVKNGEFMVTQVTAATNSKLGAVAACAAQWMTGLTLDKSTMFAMPNTETCWSLRTELEAAGVPCAVVLGETPYFDRQDAFNRCIAAECVLIQVQVVSEGVDLPIRRLVDMSPTLSPVRWLQQFGRITRPTEDEPEYVCTNRNLLRHGYLLEGCVPPSVIRDASAAFPPSTNRAVASRAIGLEAIGRFKGVELPLRDGLKALCYALSGLDGHKRTDYFVIVHPAKEEPIWAKTEHTKQGETWQYGKWSRCQPPEDLSGFSSLPPKSVSEKQANWWRNAAGRYGLDDTVEPNRKIFQALPVLSAIGGLL